jgi:hypothetical protein
MEQVALVPAPAGAPTVSPLLEDGAVSLAGGITTEFTQTTDHRRAAGHATLETAAHARLSGGLQPGLELSFGGDFGSASWGTVNTAPLDLGCCQEAYFWRIGPALRGRLSGDATVGLGGLVDISVASMPYRRLLQYTVTGTTSWDPDSSQTIRDDRFESTGTETFVFVKAGIYGQFGIGTHASITLGALAQTVPYFPGTDTDRVVCRYYQGQTTCPELSSLDVDVLKAEMIGTVFFGASGDLGPLTLSGQFFAHTSDSPAARTTPFGADLSLAYRF